MMALVLQEGEAQVAVGTAAEETDRVALTSAPLGEMVMAARMVVRAAQPGHQLALQVAYMAAA